MTGILQHRRSNTAGVSAATPAAGELVANTDNWQVYIGDGSTAGGHRLGRTIVETHATTYAVALTDAGKDFNTIGAAGAVTFDLPAAAAGVGPFGFYVAVAQNLIVDPNGTDLIKAAGETTTNGGTLSTNVQYAYIQIMAHQSGIWIVRSMIGGWTWA